jgi:RNA polymerase sigma factor (TIGR02999 family)
MLELSDITQLLAQWADPVAREKCTALVYAELRQIARRLMSSERPEHTLQATALVHEAYLKLVGLREVTWNNRAHFFGAAANIMRRILVDHAKKNLAAKRGSRPQKLALTDDQPGVGTAEELVAVDEALAQLAAVDERKVRVAEMRIFSGMTNQEIAAALEISDATVERDWKMARAWLIRALEGRPAG